MTKSAAAAAAITDMINQSVAFIARIDAIDALRLHDRVAYHPQTFTCAYPTANGKVALTNVVDALAVSHRNHDFKDGNGVSYKYGRRADVAQKVREEQVNFLEMLSKM